MCRLVYYHYTMPTNECPPSTPPPLIKIILHLQKKVFLKMFCECWQPMNTMIAIIFQFLCMRLPPLHTDFRGSLVWHLHLLYSRIPCVGGGAKWATPFSHCAEGIPFTNNLKDHNSLYAGKTTIVINNIPSGPPYIRCAKLAQCKYAQDIIFYKFSFKVSLEKRPP